MFIIRDVYLPELPPVLGPKMAMTPCEIRLQTARDLDVPYINSKYVHFMAFTCLLHDETILGVGIDHQGHQFNISFQNISTINGRAKSYFRLILVRCENAAWQVKQKCENFVDIE